MTLNNDPNWRNVRKTVLVRLLQDHEGHKKGERWRYSADTAAMLCQRKVAVLLAEKRETAAKDVGQRREVRRAARKTVKTDG